MGSSLSNEEVTETLRLVGESLSAEEKRTFEGFVSKPASQLSLEERSLIRKVSDLLDIKRKECLDDIVDTFESNNVAGLIIDPKEGTVKIEYKN